MDIIHNEIMDYAQKHTSDEPKLLQELRRETWQKILSPRMLSGHFQGRFLAMISKMIQPKSILEIGTYTGYATLCLAEGLAAMGRIYTIDNNEELEGIQKKYFKKSGFEKQITQITGDALSIIPTLNTHFDLVFIDADKQDYIKYYDLLIDQVNKGGIILSDNVLWNGKVVDKSIKNDRDTESIKRYNLYLKQNNNTETILLPFRDGISITRKI